MAVVITVQEAAQMLKLHPRTIMNMARRGEIPSTKIGRQWRFDAAVLEKWLAEQMAINGRAKAVESLSAEEAGSLRAAEARPLAELLEGSVRCVTDVRSKDEVLEALAEIAHAKYPRLPSEQLLDALTKREAMFPTAIRGGIAFPHPRRPLNGLSEPIIALLNVRKGVEFGAPDGKPTYTFVLVCSPDDAAHLRLLARLAAFFREGKAREAMKRCESPREIEDLVRRLESRPAHTGGSESGEAQ
jgi:excisionase family DNA binding protein